MEKTNKYLDTMPVVVITDLRKVQNILSRYGTTLPIDNKKSYGGRVFAYLLCSNAKHTGEFLYLKIKKHLSMRHKAFDKMREIFENTQQKSTVLKFIE